MKAEELLFAICRCYTVISLFVLERVSLLFSSLLVRLQANDLDILEACEAIQTIARALHSSGVHDDLHEVFVGGTAIESSSFSLSTKQTWSAASVLLAKSIGDGISNGADRNSH